MVNVSNKLAWALKLLLLENTLVMKFNFCCFCVKIHAVHYTLYLHLAKKNAKLLYLWNRLQTKFDSCLTKGPPLSSISCYL